MASNSTVEVDGCTFQSREEGGGIIVIRGISTPAARAAPTVSPAKQYTPLAMRLAALRALSPRMDRHHGLYHRIVSSARLDSTGQLFLVGSLRDPNKAWDCLAYRVTVSGTLASMYLYDNAWS
jgi:hypothetical protein